MVGVDKKDGQEVVTPNQKGGDEILRRMLKTPPKPHEKLEGKTEKGESDLIRIKLVERQAGSS